MRTSIVQGSKPKYEVVYFLQSYRVHSAIAEVRTRNHENRCLWSPKPSHSGPTRRKVTAPSNAAFLFPSSQVHSTWGAAVVALMSERLDRADKHVRQAQVEFQGAVAISTDCSSWALSLMEMPNLSKKEKMAVRKALERAIKLIERKE